MELLKAASCKELRELLNVLKAMELQGTHSYKAVERVRRRIEHICDLLDAVDFNEQTS